ncbi:hypothetical protein [Streptomyces sp. NPDC055749]
MVVVPAGDFEDVAPAVLGDADAWFESHDRYGLENAGFVVDADALGDAALIAPQLVSAAAGGDAFVDDRIDGSVLFVDHEEFVPGECVTVEASQGRRRKRRPGVGQGGLEVSELADYDSCLDLVRAARHMRKRQG